MTKTRCQREITVLAILAVALLGCGQTPTGLPRGMAHGKISLDGKPIEAGTISFVPMGAAAGPAWAVAIQDGQYVSGPNGPLVGKNRVEIRASSNPSGTQNAGGDWKSNYVELVPVRYNTQSTLEVDVRPGDNTFDFDLKSR